MSVAILVDVTRCTGCERCAVACVGGQPARPRGRRGRPRHHPGRLVREPLVHGGGGGRRGASPARAACTAWSRAASRPAWSAPAEDRARGRWSTTRTSASAAGTACWPAPSRCRATSGPRWPPSCGSATCAPTGSGEASARVRRGLSPRRRWSSGPGRSSSSGPTRLIRDDARALPAPRVGRDRAGGHVGPLRLRRGPRPRSAGREATPPRSRTSPIPSSRRRRSSGGRC